MRSFLLLGVVLLHSIFCQSFAPGMNHARIRSGRSFQKMRPACMILDHSTVVDTTASIAAASNSLLLAETEAWVQPFASFLDPFLNLMSFAMLARVVLSWYPETKLTDVPWVLLVIPTEPLLRIVKGVVPPAFGVDISPVFWLAIFTFAHEILLGQQGLLTMKIKYGI